MVALAVLFDTLLGGGEINGHVIVQLQNTNDLAALRCVSADRADLPQVGAVLSFHHLDCGHSWLS